MKNTILYLFLILALSTSAQQTWNHRLPLYNTSSLHHYAHPIFENGHFLIGSSGGILEMDPTGLITGRDNTIAAGEIINFVRRHNDNTTGEMVFLVGTKKVSPASNFTFRLYKPGAGDISELVLTDNLGNTPSYNVPIVVPIDDSTFTVFGRQMAFKVRVNQWSGFSQLWEQPITFSGTKSCRAAVQVNGGFMLLNSEGEILGLNSDGQQIFNKTHAFSFSGAIALPDGILACGADNSAKAVLVKLNASGDLVWSKVFPDKRFNDVISTPDGGFLATGQSADGKITLVKTNAAGLTLWTKEYETGYGGKIIPMPDGGFYISAVRVGGFSLWGIKTDATGATTPATDDFFVQNRRIQSPGVQATFEPWASLFFNGDAATLVSPPDSGVATLLAFSPWIGGFDGAGNLHLSAEDYRSSAATSDFQNGPLQGQAGDYERVWLLKKDEIDALRRDFLTDQILDNPIPYDVLTWPAKGNPNNHFNLDFSKITTDPLLLTAPFVDRNGDGLYNVYDGDYPVIKGDQMVWWMMNDVTQHLGSNGTPLQIDMTIAAYLYECGQNQAVNNTILIDFSYINRSATDYDSTFVGFFTDADLGCYLDDFIGCLPDVNSYYVYNQDASDDDCSGVAGFGANIPVESVTFQNKGLNHFMYYNNAIGNPPPAQTDPNTPLEYYQYLNGQWRDGTPATAGGSGFNPNSTDYVDYMFPGNPADPQSWSMCSTNLPFADRRMLPSHGPFTFAAGDTFRITVAFTTHRNIPHPCPDIFGLVKPAIEQLTDWSNSGLLAESPNLGVVQLLSPGQSITLGNALPGATYQWSTGANTPTIQVVQPGEYSVTMTNSTGCQKVENVLVQLGLKTNAPNTLPDWQLYPNPAAEFVRIACPDCDAQAADGNVIIRNGQGALVREATNVGSNTTLPLQGVPAGFYWVELWQGKVFLGSRKLTVAPRN